MAYWTDDRHLYVEQKRLDARQAEAKTSMENKAMTTPMTDSRSQDRSDGLMSVAEVLAVLDAHRDDLLRCAGTMRTTEHFTKTADEFDKAAEEIKQARATIAAWNVSPSADAVGLGLAERMEAVTHDAATEALDSLDDFARMNTGVDAKGPRGVLERYIGQQRCVRSPWPIMFEHNELHAGEGASIGLLGLPDWAIARAYRQAVNRLHGPGPCALIFAAALTIAADHMSQGWWRQSNRDYSKDPKALAEWLRRHYRADWDRLENTMPEILAIYTQLAQQGGESKDD